jgi:hypothetical protein
MRAANKTKALIVGISRYTDVALTLGFAASNARSLADNLTLDEGCAVPKEQVRMLCDEEAHRTVILEELKAIGDRCETDDTLIFYFSGHGEKLDSTFYLLPVEANRDDLDRTAIHAEELQLALESCRAGGILFILDCCKSAGFAEEAQKFFTTLPTQEFRILLSASRSGQLSFEFSNSQGTLFTKALVDVLRGRVIVGSTPGVVYFSDLFEYVQRQIAEDLESLGHDTALQEPVFAGSFTKDPRLFILRELSLERIEAESPRYSRKFVQRRIRRLLAGVCCLTMIGLAAYYTYLDHTRYIWHEAGIVNGHEGDYVSIYAGDPRYNWLGFPHRILTTDIRVEGLPSAIRPGVGQPLRTRWSLDIQPLLFPQLSAEWKTAVSAWMLSDQHAWDNAKDIDVYDEPDVTGQEQAAEALASIAAKQDISKLEDLVSPDAYVSTPPAMRRIAQLDPEHAIDMLGDELDDEKFERAVLQGLPTGCSKAVTSFLSRMAKHSNDNSYIHNAWFGALTRTDCSLPLATVMKLPNLDKSVWDRNLDWLPYLSKVQPPQFSDVLAHELKLVVRSPERGTLNTLQQFNLSLKQWTLLRTAAVLYPASVPQETTNLLSSTYKHVRFAAARALLAKDQSNSKLLISGYWRDPWILSALMDSGWFSENLVRQCIWPLSGQTKPGTGDYADVSVMYLLKVIRLRRITSATTLVQEIAAKFAAIEVKAEAERTLEALSGSRADSGQLHQLVFGHRDAVISVDSLPRYAFLKGTYSWLIRSDSSLLNSFFVKMGDDPDDAAELIGRHLLPDALLAQLRKQFERDDLRLKLAAVLAMQGSEAELKRLLTSPDVNLRTEAMVYAIYNPNFNKILDLPAQFDTQTKFYLLQQSKLMKQFDNEWTRVPIVTRGLALGVMMGEVPDVSWGLRLKLEDQVDELEGITTDGGEEVGVANGPPPVLKP